MPETVLSSGALVRRKMQDLSPSLRDHLKHAKELVRTELPRIYSRAPEFRRDAQDYSFDVKYYGGTAADLDSVSREADREIERADGISLYLHFPLCPYACRFCHYHIRTSRSESEHDRVLEALEGCSLAIQDCVPAIRGKRLSSIYLGGGTPSLLSLERLGQALAACHRDFDCSTVGELTVEVTPDTSSRQWLQAARQMGVTRVSTGVQILDDRALAFTGRGHTTADVLRFFEHCSAIPDLTVNVDLIAGLPHVSEEAWLSTLRRVVSLDPSSVTIYRLRLGRPEERNSNFAKVFEQDRSLFPTPEETVVQVCSARSILQESGYEEGPVGWFSRGGYPQCYRDRWLEQRPLIGIGESAYSYGESWQVINAKGSAFSAAVGKGSWPLAEATILSPAERALRSVAWRLRADATIPRESIGKCQEVDAAVAQLVSLGLLEGPSGCDHRLTQTGLLFIDEIIRKVLHPQSCNFQ